jgi:putative transposase
VLGIVYQNTRPYGPEQNAKQEVLWAQVEGRLLAMLEGERELSLSLLNEATQAWVEQEYNRSVHAETRQTPLQRFLDGPDVSRPSPSSDALRQAFRRPATRTQRQSDGTISVEGIRFEVPARYRPLKRVHVRYAEWDLSTVDLCDERTGAVLCALFPLDKAKNSDAKRRALPREARPTEPTPEPRGIAPLLRKLMADYAATGLPPAYLAHDDERALSGDDT